MAWLGAKHLRRGAHHQRRGWPGQARPHVTLMKFSRICTPWKLISGGSPLRTVWQV